MVSYVIVVYFKWFVLAFIVVVVIFYGIVDSFKIVYHLILSGLCFFCLR